MTALQPLTPPPLHGVTVAAAKRRAALIEITGKAIWDELWAQCRLIGAKGHPFLGSTPDWSKALETERQDYRAIAERMMATVRRAREEGRV